MSGGQGARHGVNRRWCRPAWIDHHGGRRARFRVRGEALGVRVARLHGDRDGLTRELRKGRYELRGVKSGLEFAVFE